MNLPTMAGALFLAAVAALAADSPGSSGSASKRTGKVYIQVFTQENFKGNMVRVPVPVEISGSAELKKYSIANDSVASLKVPAGVVVTLYDGDGFGGDHESFTGNAAQVGKLKARASSMKTAFSDKAP